MLDSGSINSHLLLGNQFLRLGKTLNALSVFKKNVKNYPRSANVYDSLASAYEKIGSIKLARENYEKAFVLANARGDERLATIFKAKLEKLKNK